MRFSSPAIVAFSAVFAMGAVALAQDAPAIGVDPAIATMSSEQLVEARQNAMKQDGMILRGATRLAGEDAIAAATTLLQNFTNFPALFKEGSITGESEALPAIWENWEDFRSRFDADAASAAGMLAAAQSGDTATYAAAAQEIGESCFACHTTYRGR